jgi:hypothetical protein
VLNLIVWSKDRACQLDLLLRSIKKNANLFSVSVLYTYSPHHEPSYKNLIEEYTDVNFVQEKDFRADTISLIESSQDYVCFSTDDMVFYRPVPCEHLKPSHNSVFSFRLGLNTIKQDIHNNTYQPALNNFSSINSNLIGWQTRFYHPLNNYGYPLALDTHIFPISSFLPIVKSCKWNNSNTLEGSIQKYSHLYEYIYSFNQSVSVNIPTNNMSGVTKSGEFFKYSSDYLLDMYLKGKRISLDFSEENIIGCHQEVEFKFHG